MLSQLTKDIHNVQHRILDHRPFLAAEIESFRINFETKRNDREVELLFKCTETTGEIKYELSERCIALGKTHLQELNTELNTALVGVENFLAQAKETKPIGEKLAQSRVQRAQKKENFTKDLEYAYQRVANSFEEKEEEISELYSDLQFKLNIPK